jgi:phospholipid/cholesterol/gamma-HCH transport system substrate-binding protein
VKIKFNLYERVAGFFVLTAIIGTFLFGLGVAIKRGWFEPKVAYRTSLPSADGLHVGTLVQVAGLRAGQVDKIELKSSNEVIVTFEISKKYSSLVKEDSEIRIMRPFVIGEKVLELTVGSETAPVVEEGHMLVAGESIDLLDLMSGKKIGPYLATLSQMMENLKYVAEAFLDPKRSRSIVQMFDEMAPLMRNTNTITKEVAHILKEVNKKDQLTHTIQNLANITSELNKVIPQLTETAPQLGHDLGKISTNLAVMTEEMNKVLPLFNEMAPEFPRVGRRAIEALDETVITLKAMQKSFLLRGSVKDVKEEEASKDRLPASDEKPEEKEEKKD